MNKIRLLSQEIVSQIAAGEVVESPSNVVKELIENSLDAGANNIRVYIAEGGFKEITVIDDGCGMSKSDLDQCYKRYTTSKISDVNDLQNIKSLGFRGEALFSISSVSNMYISSRHNDNIEGNYLEISEDKITSRGMIGMPVGTKISVRELFYNVPARRKSFENYKDELKKISDVIIQMSLANYHVGFSFYNDGQEVLNLLSGDLEERIREIFSEKLFSNLVFFESEEDGLSIKGYICKPQTARNTRSKQYTYVNNRYVKSNSISDLIKLTYGNLLDAYKHPIYILFLNLPENLIDVNVHPKKEEVGFLDESRICLYIQEEVTKALEGSDLTYIKHGYKKLRKFDYTDENNLVFKDSGNSILQIHKLYLVKEDPRGLLIIDQHAAHERIIYEYLISKFVEKLEKEDSILLSRPLTINLDLPDRLILEKNMHIFEKLGFLIDLSDSIKIEKIPDIFENRNIEKILKEFLDSLDSKSIGLGVDASSKMALSHLACKLAIKDGDILSSEERLWLYQKLEETKTNYICPHGRPAKVLIPLDEIGKFFGRF